jgi:hypothetical protein
MDHSSHQTFTFIPHQNKPQPTTPLPTAAHVSETISALPINHKTRTGHTHTYPNLQTPAPTAPWHLHMATTPPPRNCGRISNDPDNGIGTPSHYPLLRQPTATHPDQPTPSDSLVPASLQDIFSVLTETQSKFNLHIPTCGLMFPGPLAQAHPAGPMLAQYGTSGCPADIEADWTLEQLDQAVHYGAHPSAESLAAATALRAEALEKVGQGFARLIPWKQLRADIASGIKLHTKISPIAAIPHKSRLFRMILDLSHKGARRGQAPTPSVNSLTRTSTAPSQSMEQLGQSLGRVIYAVAIQPKAKGPILFCKLDIKDGFWRMCVPKSQAENFCYVLPRLPTDTSENIQIVIPEALQMGWTSSPAFFCAATETAMWQSGSECSHLFPHTH